MNVLNKNVLKEYNSKLRNVKYGNVLQRLKLTYNTEKPSDPYIYLDLIKVKRKCRYQGYGSKVLRDIVQFADKHNVRVELYAANLDGTPLNALYKFYRKNGFVLIKNNKKSLFVHRPRRRQKKL